MLNRVGFTFAFGLLASLGWAREARAQAQPVIPAPPSEAPPPAPVVPPSAAAAPAPAPPAEQPLPPAPAQPTPAAAPLAPAASPAPADAPQVAPVWPVEPKSTAPTVKRSRFYGTVQLGGGYFHATSGAEQDTRRFSGGTISGTLAIGGRVSRKRNVALAGAFVRDQVIGLRSRDQRIDGDEPDLHDATFALWAVGFLVDVALQREPGLHFQGLVGVGALSVSRDSGDPDDPTGLMASLAAGYDFKVGGDLALGVLLRATYAPLDINEVNGTTVKILVPALLITAATR